MKFRFRLQKSLEFTAMKEKKKQAEVARSLQERNEAERAQKALEEALLAHTMVEKGADPIRWAPFLTGTDAWLSRLRRAQRELEVASERLEYERNELNRILAKRKAMERVKEERRREFRVGRNRREQKVMDDLNRLLKDLVEKDS